MSKHRFYVIVPDKSDVYYLDSEDEQLAKDLSLKDDHVVIDTEENEWILDGTVGRSFDIDKHPSAR